MKTKDIAEFLGAELVGDPDIEITGIASLEAARRDELSFSSGRKPFETTASAVIVPSDFDAEPTSTALIRIADPKLAFTRVSRILMECAGRKGWSKTALISATAAVEARFIGDHVSIGEGSRVGSDSEIMAGVCIGQNVSIGERTTIHPNCVIYDGSQIGSDCVIHAGTVIGSDGFGYVRAENGEHLQFPQVGSVVIEDNVEIGANCCIDRGSLGETRIGEGTKIDNMVHIAHNVQIGKRVLIAGQSGIAGSSIIEDDVVIAGQVGISDHVTIKAGAIIGAKSAVFPNKIVRAGFWSGIPVQPIEDYTKQTVLLRNLERLQNEVADLKKRAGE
ncbi:MAG: UDP-3-O-(3-hydroxymyristoyl)glucosamine N-acyltransferase [Pyrinomonadaceae bacterium]